jgi:hypothetical protein
VAVTLNPAAILEVKERAAAAAKKGAPKRVLTVLAKKTGKKLPVTLTPARPGSKKPAEESEEELEEQELT